MTYKKALRYGTDKLTEAAVETPYLDSVVLLAEACGQTKEKVFASFTDRLEEGIYLRFKAFLEERLKGLPVSYIRRKKEFYGREFYVDSRVLVPRPDTEILVEQALRIIRLTAGMFPGETVRLLDLCTGTGCIPITLSAEAAEEGMDLSAAGADISEEALEVFGMNSRAILGKEIPFTRSDLFEKITGTYSVITANPPYLTTEEMNDLRDKNWPEPDIALHGGQDGLDIMRRLVEKSVDYLETNGYLLLEASPPQMGAIKKIMFRAGFKNIEIGKDLAGRDRVILGRNG